MTGKYFEEMKIGETFSFSLTVTEAHLVLFSGLTGDFNPVHTNEIYCQNNKFKTRCIHGALTSAFMASPIGQYFYGTGIALLNLNTEFKKPVFPGNTVTAVWRIIGLEQKNTCGLVHLECCCTIDDNSIVATANTKVLVKNKSN